MKRYRTLDYKQVQEYIKKHKLHLNVRGNLKKRINDLDKLNQQLQSNDGKINSFLVKYFEHNLKVLPHLLTLPTTYAQALLLGIYGYIPELRKKYHVNGYCSPTEHYYFVFHKANLHTKQYWKQLNQNIMNATQIPIYYETLIRHNLKPYLQNFRDMCYSNKAITKLCFINSINLQKNKHQLVVGIHNKPCIFIITNIDLKRCHRIRTNVHKNLALYQIKNRHVLIKSKDLVQVTK